LWCPNVYTYYILNIVAYYRVLFLSTEFWKIYVWSRKC